MRESAGARAGANWPDGDLQATAEAFEQALTRLTLLEQRLFASQLDHCDLTPAQYHALAYMSCQPQACSMGCLAEQLHQSSAATTGLVDRLVRRSLAERRADSGDRRRVMVRITESGVGLVAQARALRRQRTLHLLSSLDHDDRLRLCKLLQGYVDQVADALGDAEKTAP